MGRWRAALKWVGHKKDAKSPKGGWSRTQGGGEGHRWAGMTAGGQELLQVGREGCKGAY